MKQKFEFISNFSFSISIILWYIFTILSSIFSKKYLNLGFDAHTLTLICLLYPVLLKLTLFKNGNDSKNYLNSCNYVFLGLFNIGTILLTNIGLSQTSVSLIFMIKVFIYMYILKQQVSLNQTFLFCLKI